MPCTSCPVPEGSPCDESLCPLAGTAPHWDRHILGRMRLLAGAGGPIEPGRARAYWARKRLVQACPYRWDDDLDSGCGCHEPRVCLMGRGRENYHVGRLAIVTLQDCMNCVSAP
jgi:hypothetical protein